MATRKPIRISERRRPIREHTINLSATLAGTWVKVRLNPPLRVYDLFGSDVRAGLGQIVLGWNLVDEDGSTVPLDERLAGATDEELAAIAQAYMDVLKARVTLPN